MRKPGSSYLSSTSQPTLPQLPSSCGRGEDFIFFPKRILNALLTSSTLPPLPNFSKYIFIYGVTLSNRQRRTSPPCPRAPGREERPGSGANFVYPGQVRKLGWGGAARTAPGFGLIQGDGFLEWTHSFWPECDRKSATFCSQDL